MQVEDIGDIFVVCWALSRVEDKQPKRSAEVLMGDVRLAPDEQAIQWSDLGKATSEESRQALESRRLRDHGDVSRHNHRCNWEGWQGQLLTDLLAEGESELLLDLVRKLGGQVSHLPKTPSFTDLKFHLNPGGG